MLAANVAIGYTRLTFKITVSFDHGMHKDDIFAEIAVHDYAASVQVWNLCVNNRE